MAAIRRFIYLIVSGGVDSHTLHRIDTSPLFAASVGVGVRVRAQQGPPPPLPPPATLPSPLARFNCTAGQQFLPLGRGVEKIVTVDRNRHTIIFDTRTAAVRAGPDARHVKWHDHGDMWTETGGRLYHLGRGPGFEEQACLDFEALVYDHHRDDWSWNLLPSPPLETFLNETVESFADAGAGEVVAGAASAIIRISTFYGSTYAFDVARASWRKEGEWTLPFHGRAQYVAEYGLWFGFTGFTDDDDDREWGRPTAELCAADLDVVGRPACRHVWANVDGHANNACNWLEHSYLSYLGCGRFCVTRFFNETDKDGSRMRTAVVTALEATCGATGEIQMVRRASVRYHSPTHGWAWAY